MGFGAKSGNRMQALRAEAGLAPPPAKAARAAQPELRAPPPRPQGKDISDELAAKAERLSQLQHETSLLSKKPRNDRAKDRKEKKKGGLYFQLLLVIVIAAGVAVALDPQLMDQAMAMVDWEALKATVGLN
jgi:hypothetical protein